MLATSLSRGGNQIHPSTIDGREVGWDYWTLEAMILAIENEQGAKIQGLPDSYEFKIPRQVSCVRDRALLVIMPGDVFRTWSTR